MHVVRVKPRRWGIVQRYTWLWLPAASSMELHGGPAAIHYGAPPSRCRRATRCHALPDVMSNVIEVLHGSA